MTVVSEVKELACLTPDQAWPLGVFVKEPPMQALIGDPGQEVEVINWHTSQDEDYLKSDHGQRLAMIGHVLGGLFGFGHLDPRRDAQTQLQELNGAIDAEQPLYLALRSSDLAGPIGRNFVLAGLGQFILCKSETGPAPARVEPVVLGRNGSPALLRNAHSGWLFYRR